MPIEVGGVPAFGKILAGNAPGATLTTLYTAPAIPGRGATDLDLFIENISTTTARTFRVQVINAAATVTRYLAYDVSIPAASLPVVMDFPFFGPGDLIKTYGLHGFSAWALGQEVPDIHRVIQK